MRKKLLVFGLMSAIVLLLFTQVQAATKFKDIKGHWAEQTILWAEKRGIADGYPDKTFRPNNHVTEAEFLALLIRSYDPINFKYIKNHYHWADSYYAFAKYMNYPNEGFSDKKKRDSKIRRQQVAEIISATQGVNYHGGDAIHYLLGKGLAKGKNSNDVSIGGFGGNDYLTRAEAVTFIKNVLDKGITDESGKPIMKPRPSTPSPKEDLPVLPQPTKPNPTQPPQKAPTKPTKPIGSVDGKTLFNSTKDYAKSLGFNVAEYVNTTGRFSEGEELAAGLYFTYRPNDDVMSFEVTDWRNKKYVELFKKTIDNYGLDSNYVVNVINDLELNSGVKIEYYDIELSLEKRENVNNGKHNVGLTVWY